MSFSDGGSGLLFCAIINPEARMTLTISITPEVDAKLRERAQSQGRDVAEVAADLIRQGVTAPTLDEILAPVRRAFAKSGMSDNELAEFLEGEKHAMRSEKVCAGETREIKRCQ